MKEFRVKWQQCPTNYHDSKILFIEAATKEDAEKIARNHIERRFGIEWFQIQVTGETDPVPEGRVLEK